MTDFKNVKKLTIPEGNVVKITSGGTVLWEKQLGNPELYDPSAITLGYRYSGSPGTIVAGAQYFITDFIPASPGEILEVISDGSNVPMYVSGVTPQIEKVAFYNSEKIIIGSAYCQTAYTKVEKIDDSTVRYYCGLTNDGAQQSYYANIAYVRFCICVKSSPATMTDASFIQSIKEVTE